MGTFGQGRSARQVPGKPSSAKQLWSAMLRLWKSIRTRLARTADETRAVRVPLRILRLERRRLLSADFALAATGLVLDGFDGARNLTISESEGEYRFTLDQGTFEAASGDTELPAGVRIAGQTLAVDQLAVDPLVDGVTIVASDSTPLNVTLAGGNFGELVGGLTLDGIASINASPASAATLPGGPSVAALLAGPPSFTLNSLNFAGNLNLLVNGSVGDADGAEIIVGGDFTLTSRPNAGVAGIGLAEDPSNTLSVGGLARFEAQSADASSRFEIHVGVDDFGEPAGDVTFGSLAVFGGKATVSESDATTLADSDVVSLDLTSAGPITDAPLATINVADNASFTAANPADNAITLNATNNFGSLTFNGGEVSILEASSTELAGASSADSLDLDSLGAITDAPGASLGVTNLADIESITGDTIALAETHTFGSLRFAGGAVAIDEADGTLLAGSSAALNLSLASAGPIADAVGAELTVIGLARFDSTTDEAITLDGAANNLGRLQFDGGDVDIFEASDTIFSGVSDAATLTIISAGSITDDGTANVNVDGLASFAAAPGAPITLDDQYTFGQLRFDGAAVTILEAAGGSALGTELADVSVADTLTLVSAGPLTDAVGAQLTVANRAFFDSTPDAAITLNSQLAFGSLGFDGGAVAIVEADATVLSGVSSAASLSLFSGGSITDDGTADVTVTGSALFDSTPDAAITLDDLYNFGTLTFDGGAVTIVEQSSTELADASSAATLDLDSLGSITDTPGTLLDVTGLADFTAVAGDAITLGDVPGETHTFGSLTFSGGAVTISEAAGGSTPGTLLASASLAASLALTSDGPIDDAGAGSLTVLGNAAFDSTPDAAVTLTDGANNFGTLTFNGGPVTIVEQSATVLTGDSTASSLTLESAAGSVTDTALATLLVTPGVAAITAAESIVLADAGAGNSLVLAGLGTFAVGAGREIAIGVAPPTGDPADGVAQIGTLEFNAPAGNVRVALDGNLVLDGVSNAADIELNAFGAGFNITDQPGTDVSFDETAILRATGDDIVLGDGSLFGFDADPLVFNPDEFLALEAANVSIVANTGINLRTGPSETPFTGSFFLRAAGTLAQVQGPATDFLEPVLSGLTPLTADRVALASDNGAVLFSQIELTSDGATPNLAIEAGGSESFAALINGRVEFPTDDIAGGAAGEFLPVNVADRTGVTAFVDEAGRDQGLELLPNGEVAEPTGVFGDAFSIVAVVIGDATVGVVDDATNTQADQLGVRVTDATGNAFLRTLAAEADGELGDLLFTSADALSETVVTIEDGVFTAIAAGQLTIDTEAPDAPGGLITTRLTSNTGTVTSVASFETLLGVPLELPSGAPIDPTTDLITLSLVGPRFILDPPSDALGAATTDQVRFGESDDFVSGGQTVTFAVGSRGEDGLIVEFEFADVDLRRESSLDLLPVSLAGGGAFPGEAIDVLGQLFFDPLNDTRDNPLGPEVEGTVAQPLVTLAPADLDTSDPFTILPPPDGVVLTDPGLEFRVVTVTNVFTEAFIQSNPLVTLLPTTVRVFNDPSINLFDQGGERSLNENANFIEADVGAVPGFSEQQPPIETPPPPIIPAPLVVAPPFAAPTFAAGTDLQASAQSDVEVILFGRVDGLDEDGDGFADDTPGEKWPQQWVGGEGDFIEQIRQLIDDGAFSEGEYRIITKSPRGEQQLDAWIKGDSEPEQAIETDDVDAIDDATESGEQAASPHHVLETLSTAVKPVAGDLAKELGTGAVLATSLPMGDTSTGEAAALVWNAATWDESDTQRDDAARLGVAAIGGVALTLTRSGRSLLRDHRRAARRRRKLAEALAKDSSNNNNDDGGSLPPKRRAPK